MQFTLVIRSGSTAEAVGEEGIARFTAQLMREAAGSYNSVQFSDEIAYLGVTLNAGAGLEQTSLSLYGPSRQAEPGLRLFADLLLRPAFAEADFTRLQKRTLTQLLQNRDQPGYIADVAFGKQIFGVAHPYGRPQLGTDASVKAFTVDKVRAFWQKHFVPSNAFLVVVGNADQADLQRWLTEAFVSWKATAAPAAVTVPAVKAPKGRTIYLVDRPGAAQSEVRIGHLGVARSTPDYYSLQTVNTLLGGSFTSRLNTNLREKNGYSYGAGSRFGFYMSQGPFVARSAVETSVTDKAVREFMNELTGIKTFTPAELDKVKNYVALGYPSDFSGVGGVAAQVADRLMYNLPADYFQTFIPNILKIDAATATKAATKYIDPNNLYIVVVGDAAKIEAGLTALKLGKVVKVGIDDVLGPKQN